MKTKTLLIAAVMFLGISVAAFAQATYTVSASPVPLVIDKGYAEKVGSIGFNTVPESDVTVTGYIYIKYGALPIANKITTPFDLINLIQIDKFVDPAEVAAGRINAPDVTIAGIEQDADNADVLVISIVPAATNAARLYSFRVSGVRVDVTEWTGRDLQASVFATENLITNGEAHTTVVYGTRASIARFTTTTAVTLSALHGGSGTARLDATEAFRNAFATVDDPTQNTLQILKISIPSIPAGITLTLPLESNDDIWGYVGTNASRTLVGPLSTPAVRVYRLQENSDVGNVEDVIFDVLVNAASPTTTLYDTGATIVPSITLGPTTVADTGSPFNDYVPRYIEDWKAATSIILWEEEFDNTFLMIPYATTVGLYDTGIAIANTTQSPAFDDEAWPMVANVLQQGEIIFNFYDNAQGLVTVSTTDAAVLATLTQGVLDSNGRLPSGKSYVILMSQLLATNSKFQDGEEFTGYVLINCRFPFAHGQYFISDFGDFTNGALMLVMRTSGGSRWFFLGAESLGN
jgi:hypothetical protein